MRIWGWATLAVLAVAGCDDRQVFVRQGVTYDRYERDFIGCATSATQAVPTNTQIGWAPYVGIYSADTNTALRQGNFDLCMRDQGYEEVALPFCTGPANRLAVAQSRLPQDRDRTMRIGPDSCFVNRPDGTPFLYTPEA